MEGSDRARHKVDVGPQLMERLRRLAESQGYTVTALVKFLLEQGLPALEARLEREATQRP